MGTRGRPQGRPALVFERVVDAVKEQVAAGKLKWGDSLPSVEQLTAAHSVGVSSRPNDGTVGNQAVEHVCVRGGDQSGGFSFRRKVDAERSSTEGLARDSRLARSLFARVAGSRETNRRSGSDFHGLRFIGDMLRLAWRHNRGKGRAPGELARVAEFCLNP